MIYRVLIILALMSSCNYQKTMATTNKTPDLKTENDTEIIYAPIVYKSFTKKNGVTTNNQEMYVQRSIQDYFIKFCESNITRLDLENYLREHRKNDLIQTVTLEVSFKNGEWDACDEDQQVESRTGDYIIIHRIVEE